MDNTLLFVGSVYGIAWLMYTGYLFYLNKKQDRILKEIQFLKDMES
ncbi:MAG TPA: CcmD family protein [Firmicutes bacterium]|nr:CcmD family protein [Bacillales bacterium]HJA41158.1 CcmD family protein [Bacillota bacterium]